MRYVSLMLLLSLLSLAGCSSQLSVEETPVDPAAETPVEGGAGSSGDNP
ncbi:hypothetical protein [Rosistilla oblonga]|uniref:Uncharacterized protein n=1 Tax=Rosistilla oblonga TaxID=2527990 RepID=A0A518IYD2_9BACT|nr:hypothetical protein [Rosistilla oblonga]QDV58095.1 hypothetical protein Mal33_41120 [Rosistilla oblonga]